MAVGDIYTVANEFIYQGNANAYIWNLRSTAEISPASVNQALLFFGTARQTAWLPLHNPSVEFRCVTARKIFPGTSLPQVTSSPASGNRICSPVLDHLPGQCSCVVTEYGDITAPDANNRGRMFVTGQCCVDQLNGVFDPEPGGYVEDLCQLFITMGNVFVSGGNTFDIGIFSPHRAGIRTGPDVPPTPPYFWPLEHVRARSLVRTQRRRQPVDPCEAVCDAPIAGPVVP